MLAALLLAQAALADARRPVPTTAATTQLACLADTRWDAKPSTPASLLARAGSFPYAVAPRHALIETARLRAIESSDATTAIAATQALAAQFEIDGPALEFETLNTIAIHVSTPVEFATLAKLSVDAVDRRLKGSTSADDYAASNRLAAAAAAWARVSEDGGLALRVSAWSHRVQDVCNEAAKIAPAFSALQADAADPAANLAVGRLLCFDQDDWLRGLPHLAKGSDAPLAALAKLEMGSDPATYFQIGDGWWDQSISSDGIAQWQLQRHACRWYSKALPHAAGPRRALIDRRAAEAGFTPQELLQLRNE